MLHVTTPTQPDWWRLSDSLNSNNTLVKFITSQLNSFKWCVWNVEQTFLLLSFTHIPCNISIIIIFDWSFCFVLFCITYLLIYIYLQGVSVEAVDPVFQAKMLDMLKQTGRWFIFPHYINIILCSEMHQKPKFKPSLNLHFEKVLKHKIWPRAKEINACSFMWMLTFQSLLKDSKVGITLLHDCTLYHRK